MSGDPTVIDLKREVLLAEQAIRPYVRETYLVPSPHFSQVTGAEIWFKLENLQHTGSFKVRGAMNRLLSLSAEQRESGVVAASTGNHGAAVAHAAAKLGLPGVVFVPRNAQPGKVEAIARQGGEIRVHGHDPVETETRARSFAEERGLPYISPYNDPLVVAGQGTIGVELERQIDRFDDLYVALGGGGLLAGTAGYLKSVRPELRAVGCSPRNSQVMIQSVKAGRVVDIPSLATLSDGTAGGLEPGSITFELCRDLADEYVPVSEEAIRNALRDFLRTHHLLIEGAAAVPLAALLAAGDRIAGRRVVVILCGANIDPETLKAVL